MSTNYCSIFNFNNYSDKWVWQTQCTRRFLLKVQSFFEYLNYMKNLAFIIKKPSAFVSDQGWKLIWAYAYGNKCVCVFVRASVKEKAGFMHIQGTRVLLISAWAEERPLKVSPKWWMCCLERASVFNLSHWRNSTTSTYNGRLSSAAANSETQMCTPIAAASFFSFARVSYITYNLYCDSIMQLFSLSLCLDISHNRSRLYSSVPMELWK